MLAVDTNVVVRYLTNDHPQQSAQARVLIDGEDVFVATTVLLETEWVLRSVYGLSPAEVVIALRALAGLPRVTLEDPDAVVRALGWMDDGLDFADALHLAKASACAAFVSFDKRLARAAARLDGIKVKAP